MTRPDDFLTGLLMIGLLIFLSGATLGAFIVCLLFDRRGHAASREPAQDAAANVLTPGHGTPPLPQIHDEQEARWLALRFHADTLAAQRALEGEGI